MSSRSELSAEGSPVLVVSRTFAAPPAVVFDAWTHAEHLARWFGPKGFTLPFHEFDVAPGRVYRCCMRSPEGKDHWLRGRWREVTPFSRLAFTFQWDDDDGTEGLETDVTCTFEESPDGHCLLTLRQAPFKSVASRDGHVSGWEQSLQRLAEYLTGLKENEL
ncbi:MAG: SRPBCC domain-containing protein [Phycisphaerae bacterium]